VARVTKPDLTALLDELYGPEEGELRSFVDQLDGSAAYALVCSET